MTLDRQQTSQTITAPQKKVIGVGNVGKKSGKATYTLYDRNSDRVEFKTVFSGKKKGFG
jgi:hypothetical protein